MKSRCLGLLLPALMTASCGFDHVLTDGGSATSTMGCGSYRYGATTDGQMIWWEVSFSDVENTPDWLPGEEPPLPLSKALALAEGEVGKYTNIPDAYRLDKVEWLHIGNHMNDENDERKWIYLVTFERQYVYRGQRFDARGTLTIPVLLDGRVIQGRKE